MKIIIYLINFNFFDVMLVSPLVIVSIDVLCIGQCRAPFASLFTQQSVNRINVNNMNELLIYSVIPNMYLYAIV